MTDFYMVVKSHLGYCLMKDKYNSSESYKDKPVALFCDRNDAISYAKLRNERPSLFETRKKNDFIEGCD